MSNCILVGSYREELRNTPNSLPGTLVYISRKDCSSCLQGRVTKRLLHPQCFSCLSFKREMGSCGCPRIRVTSSNCYQSSSTSILDSRTKKQDHQVLVGWSGLPHLSASWESADFVSGIFVVEKEKFMGEGLI